MKIQRLGFLVFNGPDSQDIGSVIGLAAAALKRGIRVEIFLMYEAALNASNRELDALADMGAVVTVCMHNSEELKIPRNEKFRYGSQYDNAGIVFSSTKYLAFT